jgi:hypothetical protein
MALPQGAGDPLHAAFEIVQQLALQGHPVPLNLLLLRKSFLTLDRNHAPARPRFQCLAGNPRIWLRSVRKRGLRANLKHSTAVARPARFLSFRAAHANAGGSLRGHHPERVFAHAKHFLAHFKNPCEVGSRGSGITRSPYRGKEVRKEHECRNQKSNRRIAANL